MNRSRPRGATPSPRTAAPPPVAPLSEHELSQLQELLDGLPKPLEPLDVSMLDGYLCGVLLQPQTIVEARWLPGVFDVDDRPLPAGHDVQALVALLRRRHAELERAIAQRQWFDPWVFELDGGDDDPAADDGGETGGSALAPASQAVYPWVAGFAAALDRFPALLESFDEARLNEPLALLYRHLDPDDLEDADALLEVIDTLEPPAELSESVEELVRATLLLADVSRPRAAAPRPRPRPRR
jgi:uncharacterized protein